MTNPREPGACGSHVALLYRDVDGFLAGAAPFVRDGIAQRDAVIVVTKPENIAALRGFLGHAAPNVRFEDAAAWYASPARALDRYLTVADDELHRGGRTLRIVGEPIPEPLSGEQTRRWTTFESLCNRIMEARPISMMCAYDLRAASSRDAEAHRSHPAVVGPDGTLAASDAYVDPLLMLHEHHARLVPAPSGRTFSFDAAGLGALRRHVRAFCEQAQLDGGRAENLVFAASEAAANAIEHGPGYGTTRLWTTADELICEIRSEGPLAEMDPCAGYVRSSLSNEGGRGFWLMHQLCDWVDVHTETRALVVRLHQRRSP